MFKRLKQVFQWVVGPNSIQQDYINAKTHVQGLNAELRSRLDNLSRDRDTPQEALAEDFQRVLDAWGMREEDIQHVVNTLYIRVVVLLLPAFLGCIVLWQWHNTLTALSAVPLFLASIAGVSVTLWRIFILKGKQFYPFNIALDRFISKKVTK